MQQGREVNEQTWASPTRFDPVDRVTWPEWGQEVIAWCSTRWRLVGFGAWYIVTFLADSASQAWEERSGTGRTSYSAEAGDLWMPLPPRPNHDQLRAVRTARPDEYAAAWADGENRERGRDA